MNDLGDEIAGLPGVADVPLATPNLTADTGIVQVVPTGAPDSEETKDLVTEIRAQHDHFLDEYGVDLAVTGFTAVGIDVSAKLGAALLPFAFVVVGLSLVLLTMVFRSVAVPIKATLGYLFSVGAAFGVVTLVFEHGFLADALHVTRLGPVISFMPIVLMGVLFGLAMDYEVFLVARIREDYVHSGQARRSIFTGFQASAKVVTAAAVIMFAVFVAFVPEGDMSLKPIALGLAVGVLVDAFVVRMTLVPPCSRCWATRRGGCRAGSTGCCRRSTSRARACRRSSRSRTGRSRAARTLSSRTTSSSRARAARWPSRSRSGCPTAGRSSCTGSRPRRCPGRPGARGAPAPDERGPQGHGTGAAGACADRAAPGSARGPRGGRRRAPGDAPAPAAHRVPAAASVAEVLRERPRLLAVVGTDAVTSPAERAALAEVLADAAGRGTAVVLGAVGPAPTDLARPGRPCSTCTTRTSRPHRPRRARRRPAHRGGARMSVFPPEPVPTGPTADPTALPAPAGGARPAASGPGARGPWPPPSRCPSPSSACSCGRCGTRRNASTRSRPRS